jgi:hypothetical protein
MCAVTDFRREGYYRFLSPAPKNAEDELRLRDAMHRVALERPLMAAAARRARTGSFKRWRRSPP